MSRRALVVGGSLGGLTAALLLRDLGWEVDVLERAPKPLEARGVGIVAHPATVRYLLERTGADLAATTAASRSVRYLDPAGDVVHERAFTYRFTSYHALYGELLSAFGTERYHLGHGVTAIDQDEDGVTVRVDGLQSRRADLVVAADGIHSSVRRLLVPEAEREYAGYVAWRGVAGEEQLSDAAFAAVDEAIVYYLLPSSHMLTYPIPGLDGSVEPGRRLVNWLWYRNVPAGPELDDLMTDARGRRHEVSIAPGAVRDAHVEALRAAADELLAPQLDEMVRKTADPFVQVVFDVAPPRLAVGRVCLIGDAATVLRPHVAVGTAKAAEAAWRLAGALTDCGGDVVDALARWEPRQLALERGILERARAAGTRSQFTNEWRIGDPLPFGLYEEGDSAMPAEHGVPRAARG